MFNINEYIVYPKYGVGKITDIYNVIDKDSEYKAYRIELISTKNEISIPIQQNLGLRALSSKKDISSILDFLKHSDIGENLSYNDDWKERKKELDILFNDGSIANLSLIVKLLYSKNLSKPLGSGERKLYDSALFFLVDEITCVLQIDSILGHHLISKSLVQAFQ